MKNEIENLLQKEMDRTAFLQHVGVGLLALTGVASILRALVGHSTPGKAVHSGFGSGAYGGNRTDN
jgi:hypothetical protein